MFYKFFKDCKTAEEGKKLYRELAKRYHTDNANGNEEVFKQVNNEFHSWWNEFKDIHTKADGTTYTKKTTETAEEFMNIISVLLNISDELEIEIRGTWLWIFGNTFPYRNELKTAGCRWSTSKKSWYWTTDPYVKKVSKLSVEAQRELYGSEFVDTTGYKKMKLEGV